MYFLRLFIQHVHLNFHIYMVLLNNTLSHTVQCQHGRCSLIKNYLLCIYTCKLRSNGMEFNKK